MRRATLFFGWVEKGRGLLRLGLAGAFAAGATAAMAGSPLSYTPLYRTERALPGESITFNLQVHCSHKKVQVVCPYVVPTGGRALPAGWVSASPSTYTFPKSSSKTFAITVSVPAGAEGGEYTAYVRCHVVSGKARDGIGCLVRLSVGYLPVAAFTFAPYQPVVNERVSFYDETDPADSVVGAWQWEFGDGVMSASANPTHAYSQPGFYKVRLTITTKDGVQSSALGQIEVSDVAIPVQRY